LSLKGSLTNAEFLAKEINGHPTTKEGEMHTVERIKYLKKAYSELHRDTTAIMGEDAKRLDELADRCLELESELKTSNERIKVLATENEKLSELFNASGVDNTKLHERVRELEAENAQLQELAAEATQKLDSSDEENTGLRAELVNLNAALEFKNNVIDAQQHNLEIERARHAALVEAASEIYKDACTQGGKSPVALWAKLEAALAEVKHG
jgi:predicted nuclease with TOPRIM domain